MRLGTSLRSAYAVDDPRLGAAWMVERARAARDAGLDSLFVGDHHATPVAYYQNTPVLGRLLAEWAPRTSGALFLLPLWPPVLAAEQIATLAAIAPGPFVVQCAIGAGDAQFAAMGATLRTRPSRFEGGLDVIRRLLAGETVTSERFGVRDASIAPAPLAPTPFWIGGAAPAAVDRAARLGDGFVIGPEATDDDVVRLADEYRERCAVHDRTVGQVVLRRDVHVGADPTDAERAAGPVLARGYRGFDPVATVVGGVAEVTDRLRGYEGAGVDEVLVRHLVDDQAAVLDSFARLAAVRAALTPR